MLVSAALALALAHAVAASDFAVTSRVKPHVLVYTATDGFRHDSIPTAVEVLGQTADKYGIDFLFTDGVFVDSTLAGFDGVMFISTTGNVLQEWGQQALQKFFQSGGSFMGVHAACAGLYNDTAYGQTLGGTYSSRPTAYFDFHPDFQEATFVPLTKDHPSTAHLPDKWRYGEEVYYFTSDPRKAGATVVLTVEEGSFTNLNTDVKDMGNPHPIAWYIESPESAKPLQQGAPKGGRSFYTSLGHSNDTWHNDVFLEHIYGGLTWALNGASTRAYGVGLVGNDTAPPPPPPTTAPASANVTTPTATPSDKSGASPLYAAASAGALAALVGTVALLL